MSKIALTKVIYENNRYCLVPVHLDPGCTTLDQISKTLPEGAYTTFRTYDHHKVIKIEQHFSRLEETARLAHFPFTFSHNKLRDALRQFVDTASQNEVRVRVTLALKDEPGTFYFSMEDLHLPASSEYIEGVKVVSRDLARKNPKAKLTDFITIANQIRKSLPEGVNEAILLDSNGRVLEGLSSNFFAVCNGEIWTADVGVLSGITRSIVIAEAEKSGYQLHFEGFLFSEIPSMDEAFITSTSRSVLPVQQIDDMIIADGKPGQITRKLLRAYDEHIHSELESL